MAFDMKKEEDVKEFLENLGIEYRFGCFSEKKPDSKYKYNVLRDSLLNLQNSLFSHTYLKNSFWGP